MTKFNRFKRYLNAGQDIDDLIALLDQTSTDFATLSSHNLGAVVGGGAARVQDLTTSVSEKARSASLAALRQEGGIGSEEFTNLAFTELVHKMAALRDYCRRFAR